LDSAGDQVIDSTSRQAPLPTGGVPEGRFPEEESQVVR